MWDLRKFREGPNRAMILPMRALLNLIRWMLLGLFRSKSSREAEILALRHQLSAASSVTGAPGLQQLRSYDLRLPVSDRAAYSGNIVFSLPGAIYGGGFNSAMLFVNSRHDDQRPRR